MVSCNERLETKKGNSMRAVVWQLAIAIVGRLPRWYFLLVEKIGNSTTARPEEITIVNRLELMIRPHRSSPLAMDALMKNGQTPWNISTGGYAVAPRDTRSGTKLSLT